mmetsp:Transcript_114010/g.303040  ORF Transcript_114010/g.303040 Transcript_114010/m.303040 type:complete len:240 (-) Transcript_114010:767-1486(-)
MGCEVRAFITKAEGLWMSVLAATSSMISTALAGSASRSLCKTASSREARTRGRLDNAESTSLGSLRRCGKAFSACMAKAEGFRTSPILAARSCTISMPRSGSACESARTASASRPRRTAGWRANSRSTAPPDWRAAVTAVSWATALWAWKGIMGALSGVRVSMATCPVRWWGYSWSAFATKADGFRTSPRAAMSSMISTARAGSASPNLADADSSSASLISGCLASTWTMFFWFPRLCG